uniref:C-type lectin domain-containing protein n=1 Tax=Oryzias latipes TaxID=8090 RepID=A0A3B3I4W1_ORYLA
SFLFLFFIFGTVESKPCRIFVYHSFKDSCYYKSTEQKTWIDSRSFCQFVGSDLVVVNSKEEQVGVFTLVPSSFLCLGFSTCIFHVCLSPDCKYHFMN